MIDTLPDWNDTDSEILDDEIARARSIDRYVPPRLTKSPRPPVCRGCGAPFRTRREPRDGVNRRHAGRGYCATCYSRSENLGEFA